MHTSVPGLFRSLANLTKQRNEGKNGINYSEPTSQLRKMISCNRVFEEKSDDSIRDQTYQPNSNEESSQENADS